jgi:hypothetical protein
MLTGFFLTGHFSSWPGFAPAIHVFRLKVAKAWIPGTSPGMTNSSERLLLESL